MNPSDASTTTCCYRRSRLLIALWPLLIGVVCACGAVQGVVQGEKIGAAFLILACGGVFGIFIALLSVFQVMAVTASQNGLEAITFFGYSKRRISWDEIDSADYYEWPGKQGSNKPPSGYAFNRRGDRKGFSFRKRRIGFGEDMVGYDALERVVREKSAEFGFPISPGA